MISEELEVSLHMAFVEARAARHEFIDAFEQIDEALWTDLGERILQSPPD